MSMTRAELTIQNVLSEKEIEVDALVDTGAVHMCVTEAQARQLGFDPEECTTLLVTLADRRQAEVARIGPIRIGFANRTYMTEALVLGDEALMGVVPIEVMDLVIDPRGHQLMVNPAHPNFPVTYVKDVRPTPS